MTSRTPAEEITARRLFGRARYAADAALLHPLHLSFLRSPVASGRITGLDISGAEAHAVHIGCDVAHIPVLTVNEVIPLSHPLPFPILAQDHVRAVGQPVAAVLAESVPSGLDAVEAIALDIDEDEPQQKVVAEQSYVAGDTDAAFRSAAHIVSCDIQHARLAPSPMEPRGIAVAYDAGAVTIYQSTQTPHRSRSEFSRLLGVSPDKIDIVAIDVGGAFGMKGSVYPEEVFAVWAAFHHKRSVRWIATRSEEFLSATQGRALKSNGRMALDSTGRITALEADISAPLGAWLPNSGLISAWNGARILPSGYTVPNIRISTKAHTAPRGPVGIYRGAGRPEANMLMERLIDKAARTAGMDPLAFRRLNLIEKIETPRKTPTGQLLDSGDYCALLAELEKQTAYKDLQKETKARRAAGELTGLGIAFYLEPSGAGFESARVTWNADGTVHIASGSSSQGQAREDTLARIAANALDVSPEDITVVCGDTRHCPEGIGALASRSTAIGGSAVLEACKALLQRRGAGDSLPLTEDLRYENEGQAWGYGAYLCLVSIDPETGSTTVEKAICVDDAGMLIYPEMVRGQIVGGFAQGFGEAMMEEIRHDEYHQLLTGSFMDYAMPRASDVPHLEVHKIETPSPFNTLGAKGIGEAGTIGAPPAILNAVLDALAPLGVTDLDMPLTPCKVWTAIAAARKDGL